MEEEEESDKRRNEDNEYKRGVEKGKMKKEQRMLMKSSGETKIHIHTRNYETF